MWICRCISLLCVYVWGVHTLTARHRMYESFASRDSLHWDLFQPTAAKWRSKYEALRTWWVAEGGVFDVIMFLGPTPQDVHRQYHIATGMYLYIHPGRASSSSVSRRLSCSLFVLALLCFSFFFICIFFATLRYFGKGFLVLLTYPFSFFAMTLGLPDLSESAGYQGLFFERLTFSFYEEEGRKEDRCRCIQLLGRVEV